MLGLKQEIAKHGGTWMITLSSFKIGQNQILNRSGCLNFIETENKDIGKVHFMSI